MPELPEVETTRLGIYPHVHQQTIKNIIIRAERLRWPIPKVQLNNLIGKKIKEISRRAKYLIIHFDEGYLLIHLGMSGHLQILNQHIPPKKHDHIDILFNNNQCLRYNDPRKFGAFLWTTSLADHPLLQHLGPEPLEEGFNKDYFFKKITKRQVPIKSFIMNQAIVVGVGNIYASEALFMARIHPLKRTCDLTKLECQKLVDAIKIILNLAIQKGGTSIQDYVNSDGKPGYFVQSLAVYQRQGQPCQNCGTSIQQVRIGQRNSFFCKNCQKY